MRGARRWKKSKRELGHDGSVVLCLLGVVAGLCILAVAVVTESATVMTMLASSFR